jgi:NAD(P)-dependent dehydrogenase (short-subunit alcohol dehydrogenase family)
MSVVLVTGAATGIGNLSAQALARDGHTVYASMRDIKGSRNSTHAQEVRALAEREGLKLHVVELDVTSQDSADRAVATVLEEQGDLDVVVHNAGHLYIGFVEAFTAEDISRLFDVNVFGIQRVNRALLPHMRERRHGTLLYVGSTIVITTPPFLGPYSASKAAMDQLALTTAYEVSQLGIETVIVMPGAFTKGTQHFPNASYASDLSVAADYSILEPLVEATEKATEALFPTEADNDPTVVAEEIVRILGLPYGKRPFRSVVDMTYAGVHEVNEVLDAKRAEFTARLGFGEFLQLKDYATRPPLTNQLSEH